ncbi:MAG TPA: hypothetical protein VGI78_26040 [Acetobacteraceae bacterium]
MELIRLTPGTISRAPGDLGHRARCHEAVLQIDNDMCGSLGHQTIEHPQSAAALLRPADDIRMDDRFVHLAPLLYRTAV